MPEQTVAKGDLIRLDYDIWAEMGGKSDVVDTTSMEVAQSARWEGRKTDEFGPVPYEIGKGKFPEALEKTLIGLAVGATIEKELAPAEAFGERDPKLIELFSIREVSRLPEMRKEGASLDIGTVLNIRGRRGRVLNVTPGRVRVDFNEPLAGKKIKAKFNVKERITAPVEVAMAIIEMEYGHSNDFGVEHTVHTLTIKIPDKAKFDINWHAAKSSVVADLRKHLKPTVIHMIEEYKTPKAEEPPKEEKKSD